MDLNPKDDKAAFMAGLASVFALAVEAQKRTATHPDANDATHFLEWCGPVHASLAACDNLGNTNAHAQQPLTDAAMLSLTTAAWLLGRDGAKMPAQEPVEELLSMLRDFQDEILSANDEQAIDRELGLYLLEHVQRMITAILLVRVKGTAGLREAVEIGHGGAFYWTATRGREPFIDRLWEKATKVATVATLATSGVAIAPGVMGALPG